jgi:hypothetical protein
MDKFSQINAVLLFRSLWHAEPNAVSIAFDYAKFT